MSASGSNPIAHADWTFPLLHPAAWEGLPPKPWQSDPVVLTKSEHIPPLLDQPTATRVSTASAA